jgi:REP element-mobilizing transposase RayT
VARPSRDASPGDFFHVCTRGNSRCDVYTDAEDRRVFLTILDRCRIKHNWRIYAWCLMTTHYHLVVATPDGGLSLGMCGLNGGFARWWNKRQGREDHLFGKRFASTKITSDEHLFTAIRYVLLNPVRAGICDDPSEWSWSSYRASTGLAKAPPLLALGELLELFDVDPASAVVALRDLVGHRVA